MGRTFSCVSNQTKENINEEKAPFIRQAPEDIGQSERKSKRTKFKRTLSDAGPRQKFQRNKFRASGSKIMIPREDAENTLCIASWENTFRLRIVSCLKDMAKTRKSMHHIKIESVQLGDAQRSKSDSWFNNCNKVILLAVADQRLLLLADKDKGILNDPVAQATREGVDVFTILVGHRDSESSDDLYPESLEALFENQPRLGHLAKQRKFISVGFALNPEDLTLNAKQEQAIIKWMEHKKATISMDRAKVTVTEGNMKETAKTDPDHSRAKTAGLEVNQEESTAEQKYTLCVTCQNKQFLTHLAEQLKDTLSRGIGTDKIDICSHLLSEENDPIPEIDMYIFAATAYKRLILISEEEPSYFAKSVKAIQERKGDGPIFIMLLGHMDSENLPPGEVYDPEFGGTLFKSQPQVEKFANSGQFLSMGFATAPEEMKFKPEQQRIIEKWIRKNLKNLHKPIPDPESKA